MKGNLLWIVASLVLGATWLTGTGAAAKTTQNKSTAQVEFVTDPNTNPVPPVDPDGSGNPFPGDPDDPDNKGTGSRGHLTLDYISNLKFKQQGISNGFIQTTATNQKPFVQVSDRRGTGTGWSLLVQPEPLVGYDDQEKIMAATLSLGYAYFLKSGSNVSRTPRVVANDTLPVGSYSLVARAQNGPDYFQGVGTWLLRLNTNPTTPVSLQVADAAVTKQQTYQGKLSWQLTDAPQ